MIKATSSLVPRTVTQRVVPGLSSTALWRISELSNEEEHALEEARIGERRVPAGRDIAKAGTEATAIYILLEGWACRYKLTAAGARQICTILVPGDVCDLRALLTNRLDCGIVAVTSCSVALLDAAEARQLASRYPGIASAFGRWAMVENAILSERILSLGRQSAQERLAHLFCELFVRLTAAGLATADGYELPLTQEQLGDALGLTGVHLNRMVQSLRSEQLISLGHGHLTILDWNRLVDLGEFDPHYLACGPGKPVSAARRAGDGARWGNSQPTGL